MLLNNQIILLLNHQSGVDSLQNCFSGVKIGVINDDESSLASNFISKKHCDILVVLNYN
ncbi:unnamed protein product [Paramecium octaurelia]|uniref:Uncharacterized protein n=1 Tax=Paramecium octaurelia TaxID=43137 RepID=A0A8S1XFJ5_PAROT|nr:unnamed protein product [Paramecium octaurelia]